MQINKNIYNRYFDQMPVFLRLFGILSLSFVLTFSSAFAAQTVEEEEVKTEERHLIKTTCFQFVHPVKEEQSFLPKPTYQSYNIVQASATIDAPKIYLLHCQWVFYE
ncbi:hypothetical protein [Marinoscillum pacificum]|uniref:hypothetical protein n=1 Tax=Marinoscillum pacificum TaxID=392723 RepID=UPI0021574E3B|nr:hypothetical protein [Marinoscillum pacificum]